MTKLNLLLLALPLLATPALADLTCKFNLVCLPDEPCKDSDFALSVTGPKSAPMFKVPVFDAYPATVMEKTGYMLLMSAPDAADWEILTVGPDGQAQYAAASAPDMALPFSYRGTCTGALAQ
jgi:hypothetical protein